MELKVERLKHQEDAVQSIVGLFEGIDLTTTGLQFGLQGREGTLQQTEFGFGNNLPLDIDSIWKNCNSIQTRNGLPLVDWLNFQNHGLRFTIEMETGTGKTFVYLNSILQLHKTYGWSKFIIVVPTIAIKEGVLQAIDSFAKYFSLEEQVPLVKGSTYKLFDSARPTDLRSFALSSQLQILVMNIQAFNKDSNKIRQELETLQSHRPLDYIIATKPILIIDEPQKVDSSDSGKGKEALASLEPLFQLRFSATHKELLNQVYRLGPVEAFEENLVKKIEVIEANVTGTENRPYLKLISTTVTNSGVFSAKVELNVLEENNSKKKTITIKKDDNLFEKSGSNYLYDNNYIVNGISTEEGNSHISFTTRETLYVGETWGGASDSVLEARIGATIKSHFQKELEFQNNQTKAKVLSLFFIDKVANYKSWDDQGNEIPGKFYTMFERQYKSISKLDEFKTLNIFPVEQVHNGYFSAQKKKKGQSEIRVYEDTKGDGSKDEEAYHLIMEAKWKLLEEKVPLRFLFSHSALQEGWDNPNVFQICTLLEASSEMKKRQQIGRGMRLPIDANGKRLTLESQKRLTVIVNESYETFVKGLQKEYEDEGVTFGKLNPNSLAKILIKQKIASEEDAKAKGEDLFQVMIKKKYLTNEGSFTEELEEVLNKKREKLDLGESFVGKEDELKECFKKLQIKNFVKKKVDPIPWKRVTDSDRNRAFEKLWEIVKQKTFYQFQFNEEKLIQKCIASVKQIQCKKPKAVLTKANIDVNLVGHHAKPQDSKNFDEVSILNDAPVPDPIAYLQKKTDLTRKSLVRILKEAGNLDQFLNNSFEYLRLCTLRIQEEVRKQAIPGIQYFPIPDSYWEQSQVFEPDLVTMKDRFAPSANRGLYEEMPCDSEFEEKFAKILDSQEKVLVFTKLPGKFRIPTPVGEYNPDWLVVEKDQSSGHPILKFFVKETKGYKEYSKIPEEEREKIQSAKRHFDILVDSYVKRISSADPTNSPDLKFQVVLEDKNGLYGFKEEDPAQYLAEQIINEETVAK